MTVRKIERKESETKSQRGKVTLSPELLRIREMIKTLPPEGEDTMVPTDAAEVTEGKKTTVKKKVPKKAAPAKTEAKSNGAAGTSLADICKGLKLDPRAARRKLRNAENAPEVEGSRWTWTKASDVERVKKILAAE